jgi:hypothetical protein
MTNNKIDVTTSKQMNNTVAWLLAIGGVGLMWYIKNMDISVIFHNDATNKTIEHLISNIPLFSRLF